MSDESYPDELHYHEARLGAGRRRVGHVRHHLVRAGHPGRGRLLQPARGRRRVTKDSDYGELESTKAVSGLIAPLSGEVVEVNEALDGNESTVNDDPYGEGWLIKVRMSGSGRSSTTLMDAAAYRELSSPVSSPR